MINKASDFTPCELTLVVVDAPAGHSKARFRLISFALILALAVSALSFALPGLNLSAAVPWASGSSTFTAIEPYITDTYVIKDGSTYKMWYTHGPTADSLMDLAGKLGDLLTPEIIDDISSKDLDALLNDLSTLDPDKVAEVIGAFSTVIGYATSPDGINWTVVDNTAPGLTGGGGVFNSYGSLCVIKEDDTTYKMWYTACDAPLNTNGLADILIDFGGTAPQRKQAIAHLMAACATAIHYATSSDGITWTPNVSAVLPCMCSLWDSLSAPYVIKEGSSYKMWCTHSATTLSDADLTDILENLPTFGVDDLLDEILAKTGDSIGYTVSNDGLAWGTPNDVLPGTNAWNSISSPTVLATSGGYETQV